MSWSSSATPDSARSTRCGSASDAFAPVAPVLVVLNRYDDTLAVHRANRDWLTTNDAGVRESDVVTSVSELVERLTRDLGPACS